MIRFPHHGGPLAAALVALAFSGTSSAQTSYGLVAATQGGTLPAATVIMPARAPAQEPTFRFRNRFRPDIYLQAGVSGPVAMVGAGAGAAWEVEPIVTTDPGYVRLRAQGNGFLNVETGPLRLSLVQPGWWSAMWVLEPVPGTEFIRIRNRWKQTYLHTEMGPLEIGEAQPGWWSAMWTMEPATSLATAPERIRHEVMVETGPPVPWVVWVKTGTRMGAGTDANVNIYLRTARGDLGPLLLDRSSHDDFESGDVDAYTLGTDFGEVTAVLLHNDGANASADWYVEWVCVAPENQGPCKDYPSTYFVFNNWLPGNAQTVWQTH